MATPVTLLDINNSPFVYNVGAATDGDNAIIAKLAAPGLGVLTVFPSASTNGTLIGSTPASAVGFKVYLRAGESVDLAFSATAPASAPLVWRFENPGSTGITISENINGLNVYITNKVGNPYFRWM